MNPHTLNANIEPWEFYNKDDDQCVYFHDMDAALEYVEKRIAEDTPVRTIIHNIK